MMCSVLTSPSLHRSEWPCSSPVDSSKLASIRPSRKCVRGALQFKGLRVAGTLPKHSSIIAPLIRQSPTINLTAGWVSHFHPLNPAPLGILIRETRQAIFVNRVGALKASACLQAVVHWHPVAIRRNPAPAALATIMHSEASALYTRCHRIIARIVISLYWTALNFPA